MAQRASAWDDQATRRLDLWRDLQWQANTLWLRRIEAASKGIIWCRCKVKKLPVAAEYEKQVYISDRNR